ncbi:hypothetical protein QCA50_012286 [Cerrena zonata]|uniref:Uncharacterized protein n=1 Tax=Cerrena zonata TaxID=2478898 RepID=A0AAW0FUH1_9APHY
MFDNFAFAAGGDSGSWILSKLEDVPSVSENKGLGVLEVTKIEWGVVGVNEKHDDESIASVDSDEDTGFESGSDAEDDDYESGMEDFDGSNPPDENRHPTLDLYPEVPPDQLQVNHRLPFFSYVLP